MSNLYEAEAPFLQSGEEVTNINEGIDELNTNIKELGLGGLE